MNPTEFASKIKAKYPEYKDIEDADLSRRIVDKYPEYKDEVEFPDPIEPASNFSKALSIAPTAAKVVFPAMAHQAMETINTPALRLSQLAPPVDPKFHPVLAAMQTPGRLLLNAGEGLSSPLNAALLALTSGAGPMMSRIAGAGFGSLMAKDTVNQYQDYLKTLKEGDFQKSLEAGGQTVLSGLMASAPIAGEMAAPGSMKMRGATAEEAAHFGNESMRPPIGPDYQLPLDSRAPEGSGSIDGPGFTARGQATRADVLRAQLAARGAQQKLDVLRQGLGADRQLPLDSAVSQGTNPVEGPGFSARGAVSRLDVIRAQIAARAARSRLLGLLQGAGGHPMLPAPEAIQMPQEPLPASRQLPGPPEIPFDTRRLLAGMSGKSYEAFRDEMYQQPNLPKEPGTTEVVPKAKGRVIPNEPAYVKPATEKVPGIRRFIRRRGGINPDLPESGDILELGDRSLYSRNSKMALDHMRESAAEAGYLPNESTGSDLIELIRKEQATGKPAQPVGDEFYSLEKPIEKYTYPELEAEFGKLNDRLGKMTRTEQKRFYEILGEKSRRDALIRQPEAFPFKDAGQENGSTDFNFGDNADGKEWPSNAGAVINPVFAAKRIVELAKKSKDYLEFRKAVAGDRDLIDTARFYKLNLQTIFDRKDDQDLPGAASSAGKPASLPGTPAAPGAALKYVDDRPLKLNTSGKPDATAKDIRESYAGAENLQRVKSSHLAEDIRKVLPNKVDREAVNLLHDAGGNKEMLSQALADPRFKDYRAALERAVNPSKEILQAREMVDQYFNETGQVGQKYNFLHQLRDNYINRLYQPDPPAKSVQTEANRSGLSKSTYHSEARVFDTMLDAIRYGKKPATLDAADLIDVHGAEFARTLTSNKLLNSLKETGLALQFTEDSAKLGKSKAGVAGFEHMTGRVPQGWVKAGSTNMVVPEWLASGIKSITDPNYLMKIEHMRGLQKYQGLVKTYDLSVSLFHHFTMAMQSFYQQSYKGLNLRHLDEKIKTPEFRTMEKDFVEHTGVTSNVDANKDVLRDLRTSNDLIDRALNTTFLKATGHVIERNNEFLFGKMQRWMKVVDYGKKTSGWLEKNPNASEAEVVKAKRGFAREVNASYGGVNWKAIGKTPSFVSLGRLGLLALDWTYSNIDLFRLAAQRGTAGQSARSHILTAGITGSILTEGLNKMLTGHYTNENPRGHQFEVQVRPGVYVSFFRGGIGDGLKWANMVYENGPLSGTSRFFQGKASPLMRTGIGLIRNIDYHGKQISNRKNSFGKNLANEAQFGLESATPVPFGLGGAAVLAQQGIKDPISYGLVGTGLARPGYQKKAANPLAGLSY